jgi:hypothetical protein
MIPITAPAAPASPLSRLLELIRQAGRQCEAIALQNAGAQQAYQHVEREIERMLAPPEPGSEAMAEAMAMSRSQTVAEPAVRKRGRPRRALGAAVVSGGEALAEEHVV